MCSESFLSTILARYPDSAYDGGAGVGMEMISRLDRFGCKIVLKEHLYDAYESMDTNSIRVRWNRLGWPERLVALVLVMDLDEAAVAVAHLCRVPYLAVVEPLPTEPYLR